MDDFFLDPNQVLLPPSDVRLIKLQAQPWPDLQRVHVMFEFTPFQKRPSTEIKLLNASGEEMGSTLIIESVSRQIDFNMYLRYPLSAGRYTLKVIVYYEEQYEKLSLDRTNGNQPLDEVNLDQEPMIVDYLETIIEVG